MSNKILTAFSATLAITLVACASTDPVTGSTRNAVISVQYGRIENIQQVAMAPSYGTGALIGGALGLLATATHSGASQVAGAAAGAGAAGVFLVGVALMAGAGASAGPQRLA